MTQGNTKHTLLDLKGLTPLEIERFCAGELRQKPGQGTRVAVWLFRKKVEDFDSMTGINGAFRELLKERCAISSLAVEQRTKAEDGTEKLLYGLDDGEGVEGVLIPARGRLTLCVSTQAGCASGCGFCLTGAGGFVRNLTAAEMVNQIFASQKASDKPIDNIVLMGTGEPLSNYDAVKKFTEIVTDRHGMGYPGKKITLSTCGIAPMIERMAEDMDVSLAVSLNAATDDVRDGLMPVNRAYPIARLMETLRNYCERTGNSVTIEYVLLKGVNDSFKDAERLAELLAGIPCMINLLLFNPFPGAAFERPDPRTASTFRDVLVSKGRVTVVRTSRGREIGAACGQLRAMASPTSNNT